MKKILITGGCGFIGSHLVDCFLRAGYKVLVLDNFSTGRLENIVHNLDNENLNVINGDVLFAREFLSDFSAFDFIIHCAVACVRSSLTAPIFNSEINSRGTLEILQYFISSGSKKFVYISTSEVYGNHGDDICTEDTVCKPQTVYAAAKLAGEHYTRVLCNLNNQKYIIIRPFNAYGPRAPDFGVRVELIPRLISQVSAGEPVTVFGDGSSSRDFTFVTELADGIYKLATSNVTGEIINLAYGRSISVLEVLNSLLKLIGAAASAKIDYSPARPGDVHFLHADTSKLQELIGWKPSISFEQGLRHYLNHIRETGTLCVRNVPTRGW